MELTPELAIRSTRAAFNAALLNADLDAIATILAPTAILVTGTDSAIIAGRKAQIMTWKREFGAADRTIYVRTSDAVTASKVEPIAFEHGHWQGRSASSGEPLARGDYTAKWRRIGASWVIEAELYLTLG